MLSRPPVYVDQAIQLNSLFNFPFHLLLKIISYFWLDNSLSCRVPFIHINMKIDPLRLVTFAIIPSVSKMCLSQTFTVQQYVCHFTSFTFYHL